MNVQYLGTTYGGWVIDLDSIQDGDTIISGGVGEDISFDNELLKVRDVKIIFVDPTEKSHKFMESNLPDGMVLLKNAIEKEGVDTIKIFKNTNPEYVSESVSRTHSSVGDDYHEVETISVVKLKEDYKPSFIKIDIEGSEYNVLEECVGIKQICVEFHHHCMDDKSMSDTYQMVEMMKSNGYDVIDARNNLQEITFLKNNII
jgi:FkbM family methyltransferase